MQRGHLCPGEARPRRIRRKGRAFSAHQAAKPQRIRGIMIRKFFSLALLVALFAAASAQQPQQTTANRLRQAVEYLASDALEGRRTGTRGANDAAHYIAGEFSLLGLQPGMQMAGRARTRG